MFDDEIYEWPLEKLKENSDQILGVLNELPSDVDTTLKNLKLFLQTFMQCYHVDELEEKIFSVSCKNGFEILSNTLKGVENLNHCDSLSQTQINTTEAIVNLLSVCIEILSYFYDACVNLSTYERILPCYVQSFVLTLGNIILETFKHWSLSEDLYSKNRNETVEERLSTFFKMSCELQEKYLFLVTKQIEFNYDLASDIEIIVSIVSTLSHQGSHVIHLDVKIMAETLKALLQILDDSAVFVYENVDVNALVTSVASKILIEVENVLSKKQYNVNTLKIVHFLLKFLIKFCGIFKSTLANSFQELITLILSLFRCTPNWLRNQRLSAEAVCDIHKYIVIGAEPLLAQLFCEDWFIASATESLPSLVSTNTIGCMMFLLSILKKGDASDARKLYRDLNCLQWVFVALGACHAGILMGQLSAPGSVSIGQSKVDIGLYQHVLTCVAVFVLTTPTEDYPAVEETLLKNILQADPWRALLACDIWCLLARYANAALCHSTLDAILPALDKISNESHRPEFSYLRWLSSRLLSLCETQYLKGVCDSFPISNHPKIWRCKGLLNPNGTSWLKNNIEFRTKAVHDDITIMDFYNLEDCLLTTQQNKEASSLVLGNFIDLWKIHIPDNVAYPSIFDRYLIAVTLASAALVKDMSSEQIITVFKEASRLLSTYESKVLRLCGGTLIDAITNIVIPEDNLQKQCFQTLANYFQILLSTHEVLVSEAILQKFAKYAQKTSYPQVIAQSFSGDSELQSSFADYLQRNVTRNLRITNNENFTHSCILLQNISRNTSSECVIPPAKRLKTSVESDEFNGLEATMINLQKCTDEICANSNRLNEHQLKQIKNISDILKNIV